MVSELEDEQGKEKESKILETETLFYEPDREGGLNFDSGMIVGGFPTSVELDPTAQVAESLKSEGVEAALVALHPGEGNLVDSARGPVYNTPTREIFSELDHVVDALTGETAVFGYCAGGVYALESGLMDRGDTTAFIGSDVPQGMENYERVMEPEPQGIVFYDWKMDGRLEARQLEVHGTDHIWVDTPGDYGEAQVEVADLLAGEADQSEIEKLEETYEWLENPVYSSGGGRTDAADI